MITDAALLPGAVAAFAVSAGGAPFVLRFLRARRVLDVPNERSSHTQPVPRGGGIAPVLGVVVAVALFWPAGHAPAALLVGVTAFGLLGLAEDLFGVPPLRRLALQAVVALATLPWLIDGMAGSATWRLVFAVGIVIWLVGYVNTYNFMDGVNGISVAQAAIAGLAWLLIGTTQGVPALAVGGAVVMAASLGFAPFNFPRASMFLGDVGSYGMGAALAILAVVGLRAGVPPEAVLAPLAIYLVDTSSTCIRRLAAGETWYHPHRDHRYQRLVKLGWSHMRVTLTVGGVMAACSLLGAVSLAGSLPARVLAGAALACLLGAYLFIPTTSRARHVAATVTGRLTGVGDTGGLLASSKASKSE